MHGFSKINIRETSRNRAVNVLDICFRFQGLIIILSESLCHFAVLFASREA
jgi:hypothetical protein